MEPEADELEIELRPAGEVARRMVLLAAFARWATAVSDDEADEQEVAAETADLREALRLGPFDADLAPSERALLASRRLAEADVLRLSWGVGALAALAWAAGLEPELPVPWRLADPAALIARVPDPWDDLDAFAAALTLQDDETVAWERERSELWLWRANLTDELASASPRERRELDADLRDAVSEADDAGLIPARAGDFAVDRRPFAQLDAETVALIAEVAAQRLHALNWLCGYGETWDAVPLDI